MHRQCLPLHCSKNYCKQDNTGGMDCVRCKNYKGLKNQTCTIGPTTGFVNSLKDKLVNLQNESQQLQFSKKPVKKKQKDYNCIMLSKINNLDRKLQNLECLFTSHLNRTQHDVLNSNNNEPIYDYMHFYESVRSLADLANRLKEDILCKQCDNHASNRNSFYFSDRIQILDSELQNLYTYLDQLRNCTYEKRDNRKRPKVQDPRDVHVTYSNSESSEDFKVEKRRYSVFKELKNNKVKKSLKTYKKDRNRDDSPCHCIECCNGSDGDSSISCQCSRCDRSAVICEITPEKRAYPPEPCGICRAGSHKKYSDCACNVCRRKRNKFHFKKKPDSISQSTSSCSCEICEGNTWNTSNQVYNNAKLKTMHVRKDKDNNNMVEDRQNLYSEINSSKNNKMKQKNKKKNLNKQENYQDNYFGLDHSQGVNLKSKGHSSKNFNHVQSKDNGQMNQSQNNNISTTKNSKTIPSDTNLDSGGPNLVYIELTPDLNIVTKRKNNRNFFNNVQDNYQVPVINQHDNNFSNKIVKDNRNSGDYRVDERLSLDQTTDQLNRSGFSKGNGSNKAKPLGKNNISQIGLNNSSGKHLHIKICKNKEIEDGMMYRHGCDRMRSPQHYKHTRSSANNHRRHDGFCHFQNGKFDNRISMNPKFHNVYQNVSSESDSFETVEGNESDSDIDSSQCKLFFCNDPDCFEKLDSDELIMLMNRTDLKHREEGPYKINVSKNVKDLKSDVCEKCTVTEKTISVEPHKAKNKYNGGKDKVVYKKEIIACSKCKNRNNDKLAKTIKTNIEYIEIDSESDEKQPRLQTNKSSNSYKRESNVKTPLQENVTDISENIYKSDARNKKNNQPLTENNLHSRSNRPNVSDVGHNNTSNVFGPNERDRNVVAAHGNIDPQAYFKTVKENSTKAMEVPGFGNLININIERGSYSFNQHPRTKIDNEVTLLPQKGSIQNKSSRSKSTILKGNTNFNDTYSSIVHNENTSNFTRNRPTSYEIITHSFNQGDNKSRSVIDLALSGEKNINKMANVKSETLLKHFESKAKNDVISNYYNNNPVITHAAKVHNGMENQTNVIGPLPKNNHMKIQKDTDYEKIPKNVLLDTQVSRYSSEKMYNALSNTLLSSNKGFVKPILSLTKVKKNRLKYNKKFRSSLSKVSSVNSVVVQQAKLYSGAVPSKKSITYPGRRTSQPPKHRRNSYSRKYSWRENCGVLKPHTVIVQESYLNRFKIPSNNIFDPRYKVETISNYLSSTVVSESSYSTLNWEKVANKLKDDKYFDDIA